MSALHHASVVTESHDLHRVRRGAFAHYLSKASLMRLEPGRQNVIAKLVSRLQGIKSTGKVMNCWDGHASLTGDVWSVPRVSTCIYRHGDSRIAAHPANHGATQVSRSGMHVHHYHVHCVHVHCYSCRLLLRVTAGLIEVHCYCQHCPARHAKPA